MLNEKVCVGYVNNSADRRYTVARWQELYEAMPIGVPLTAKEIAERANENKKSWRTHSPQGVPPMVKAVGLNIIKREKVAITPYEIEVEIFDGWDRNEFGNIVERTIIKKIIVDHKTVYTRLA